MPRSRSKRHQHNFLRGDPRKRLAILRLCLSLILGAPLALPGFAGPSCGLEGWLETLNTSADSYVKALGTAQEHQAARQFRTEMERYGREQLLKQIRAADLGGNESALMAFISSRRHLLELQKDDWPEMAARYGNDPRFNAQSQSLRQYIAGTECDPNAPDFLNGNGGQEQSFADRLSSGVAEITDIVTAVTQGEDETAPIYADPANFDEFRSSMAGQQTVKPPTVELNPSGNAAFVLGLFTFFTAISAWAWMRYGIVQRRATRYPCVLPTVVFDGIMPAVGTMLDVSQIGCKIEIGLDLQIRQKIKITCGPVARKARIVWRNNHFAGVRFDKPLSEVELKELLGEYSKQIAQQRAEAEKFGLTLMPSLAGNRTSRAQTGTGPAETPDITTPDTTENAAAAEIETEDGPVQAGPETTLPEGDWSDTGLSEETGKDDGAAENPNAA
ncbi:PilZ domain-containing protein [Celeribacter neptunius]|uniref:PilZ domain-containing protein n=1 Tax=Celeribacter neptunius TaxID=588602 RepID=A0A1I3K039_9RHOB|nr:PilZ domain-containing protein [Celeribacter neptunius]SFI65796.1 PilZ domain-containing protein [Celeribacter neptunius]